jgi:ABC-type multidrug transport system ATPase subunit
MAEIEVRGLTKTFGTVTAVRDVSFTASAGRVTGFLGPNGSGKTTTLRAALGLIWPSTGEVLIGGVPYRRLDQPRRRVGALLEATGFHPGRRARDHLRVLAAPDGLPDRRVDEVLDLAGLGQSANWRVREFSLGMRPPSLATRKFSSSMNRPTASTRPASPGSAGCCVRWRARAAPLSSPATCSARWRRRPTRW